MILTFSPLALGDSAAPAAAGEEADVSAYRDKLKVLTDGKNHYVAVRPFTISDGPDTGEATGCRSRSRRRRCG